MPFDPIQSPRIYQQIAARIAEMIVAGELKPGERLPNEHDLAKSFGVSRVPVREAMIALETGGFIEVRRSNGAYVRDASDRGVDIDWFRGVNPEPGPVEQFEMREILLPEAAALAAERITEEQIAELESMVRYMWDHYKAEGSHLVAREFTVLLATASGNSMVQSVVEELMRLHGGRLWATLRTRSLGPDPRSRAIKCREAIIRALRARDPEAAREAARAYLRLTRHIYFGDLASGTSGD